jgi:hypothetical protein
MDNPIVLILIVALVIAVGVAIWMYTQKRKTEALRGRFGPEYERAVHETGDRGTAEKTLEERKERVERLNIRPLEPGERETFAEGWRSAQAQFVDDPKGAIGEADRLVAEVMQARGYPVGEFEQRAADISVDHPQVVEHYRAAHAIAQRSGQDQAETEDLRQAMVHYRALFQDLLETGATTQTEARRG